MFWTKPQKGAQKTILDPKTGRPLEVPALPSIVSGLSLRPSASTCPVSVRSGQAVRMCRRRAACSLCTVSTTTTFRLRGLPGNSRDVDKTYSASTSLATNYSLGFLGRRNLTVITLSESTGEWVLRKENETESCLLRVSVSDGSFPVGRNVWRSCSSDQSQELSLSSCSPGSEFTCNDGSCIPLDYKCDRFPDCGEQEDEEDCNPLILPPNYQKQVAPTEGSRGVPWPVFIYFEIRAFTDIAATDFRLSVDFFMRLRWKDPRIQLKDLRDELTLNPLSDEEILSLWTPRLAITNGLTEFDSKVTEDSVGMFLANIRKRGKPIKSNLQEVRERSLYPGKWNDVIIKREYFQDFKCNFDLSKYPFDVQTCFMNFTLLGTTDIQVILREDSTQNLTYYLGEKILVEYEVNKMTYINVMLQSLHRL